MKILLVEDDAVFVSVLTRTLKTHHCTIDVVKDGEMGWTYGSTFEYDLIVLDIMLPKLDGISLCHRFRAEGYVTPILLLTSQDSNAAKVQGLDAGADDYIVKPFDPAELVARIRALLRRGSTNPFPLLTCGDLILNPSTYEVSYQGQQLTLTGKEYELLELMMRNSQHVFSTDELVEHLWRSEDFPSEATVRSHIRRVRHKLGTVGAPSDFIATMHGQGYYLKASKLDASPVLAEMSTPDTPSTAPSPEPIHALLNGDSFSDTQSQYLDFLNATWAMTKPERLDQVADLLQAVDDLQADQLTPQAQIKAQQLAHKLAGTLGLFGLDQSVHLSRQIERWFERQDRLHPNQASRIQSLVLALQQDIRETNLIQLSQLPQGYSPILLLVSTDIDFNQSLGAIAAQYGIQLEVLPWLDGEETLCGIEDLIQSIRQPPNGILLRLPEARSPSDHASQVSNDESLETQGLLHILQRCADRYPDLPIGVMGDATALRDRLEIVRCGGKLFLDRSTSLEQVMAAVMEMFKGCNLPTKVMIVDDDETWLRALPTLLKPWGFRVTTLDDPQQFWTVLQAITPDILVLDVKMPQINGFELCQILRSDPQWQRLPVLFLSVLTDSASQRQAFTVGADDYLCKPLIGGELANRILNRLQRVRSWAS